MHLGNHRTVVNTGRQAHHSRLVNLPVLAMGACMASLLTPRAAATALHKGCPKEPHSGLDMQVRGSRAKSPSFSHFDGISSTSSAMRCFARPWTQHHTLQSGRKGKTLLQQAAPAISSVTGSCTGDYMANIVAADLSICQSAGMQQHQGDSNRRQATIQGKASSSFKPLTHLSCGVHSQMPGSYGNINDAQVEEQLSLKHNKCSTAFN